MNNKQFCRSGLFRHIFVLIERKDTKPCLYYAWDIWYPLWQAQRFLGSIDNREIIGNMYWKKYEF